MTPPELYAYLDGMGISYEVEEHAPVFTIDEMRELGIKGSVCKNLFLRDAKGRQHFLVVLPGDRQADLGALAAALGSSKLSFASEERLMKHLGLTKGSVTPLAVIQDPDHTVQVLLDDSLTGMDRLGVHPLVNTATLWISGADLLRFVRSCGNPVKIVSI